MGARMGIQLSGKQDGFESLFTHIGGKGTSLWGKGQKVQKAHYSTSLCGCDWRDWADGYCVVRGDPLQGLRNEASVYHYHIYHKHNHHRIGLNLCCCQAIYGGGTVQKEATKTHTRTSTGIGLKSF